MRPSAALAPAPARPTAEASAGANQVFWNLPVAGAFVYGWAKGLLQLPLHLTRAATAGFGAGAAATTVTVYGTAKPPARERAPWRWC